jgi:hypothetical protein
MNEPAKNEKPKEGSTRKDGKKKTPRPVKRGAIETLIQQFEAKLDENAVNLTVGEYIRLKQLRKELDTEEPKEIQVTWVEPNEKESVTET